MSKNNSWKIRTRTSGEGVVLEIWTHPDRAPYLNNNNNLKNLPNPFQHSEEAESFHLGGPGLVPGDQDSHQDSPLDSRLGSTITLDSEAEFVSATSSPVMGVRKLNGDFDLASM